MRSIPAAMTWEILKRGRWSFVLAMLTSIALPALLIVALRHDGLVDVNDPSMLIMQIVLLQVGIFNIGATIYAAQGKISQLYAYPARTSELVAWRLLPAMTLMALQLAVCIGIFNLVFGLEWPVWGPALFSAVATAAVMAVAWLADKSVGWMIVGLTIVGGSLGLWFRSRYGNMFSNPMHGWQELTPSEVLTLLAIGVASYGTGVLAVARNRRGEPPLSLGMIEWLDRTFQPSASDGARLTTPFQAQCWLEWRRKGWVMPMAAFVLLIFGLIAWFFGSRSGEDLYYALFFGGHMLWALGFMGGLLFGNVGPDNSHYSMGHFTATRPMSDTDMGRAILQTAAKSILLTWSIWVAALLVVCVCLVACGAKEAIKIPQDWKWWYFPITLLGPWIVNGIFASLLLSGHPNYLVRLACASPAALVIIAVLSKFLLSRDAQLLLERTLVALATTAIVLACGRVFFAARRRQLIQGPTVWTAAIVWIAATIGLALKWPENAMPHGLGYLLIAAAAALMVLPVASVPLALSWNRHR